MKTSKKLSSKYKLHFTPRLEIRKQMIISPLQFENQPEWAYHKERVLQEPNN